jgi:beta-xylosidase
MSVQPYDPPVINAFYQADPAAHVWKSDPNTVFIYGSHDWNSTTASDDVGSQYDMKDYYVLSQTNPAEQAIVRGKILDLIDVPWAQKQLWAPDAAEKDGTYYLYFPAKSADGVFHIGVATSSTPDGTFKTERDYIKGSYSIDPAVLEDTDGSYHMYFGGLWGGQLQAWNSNQFDSSQLGPKSPSTGPALGPRYAKLSADMKSFDGDVKELVFIDQDGKQMQANSKRRFFEASSVNKIGDLYWYQYSTGDDHTIEVAVGTSPTGPFVWNSTLLQPVQGWTTHESITQFKGDYWLYYADASQSHQDNLRNTKARKVKYEGGTLKLAEPQPTTSSNKTKRFLA